MSSARRPVRERGTCRTAALLAAVALTVVTALPTTVSASAPQTRESAGPLAAAAKNTKDTKRTKKKRKKEPMSVKGMIRDEFGKHSEDALLVAHCESRLDPEATNAGAVGIFQIRAKLHSWRVGKVRGRDLNDPRTNVRVARHLFDEKGWRPWTCARIVGVTA